MSGMKPVPHGFRRFVKEQGFGSVYLIGVVDSSFLKIGVSNDPVRRFYDVQSANFAELEMCRVWWLPSRKVSVRIERKVLEKFEGNNLRGEWFVGLEADDVVDCVEKIIEDLGSWSATSDGLLRIMRKEEDRAYGRITTDHDLFMLRA